MDIPIYLVDPGGRPLQTLPVGAVELVSAAERLALETNMAKRTAVRQLLNDYVQGVGYELDDALLARSSEKLEQVRQGARPDSVMIEVPMTSPRDGRREREEKRQPSASHMRTLLSGPLAFFEEEAVFPNEAARDKYEWLVGLDDHKRRLLVEVELLLYSDRLQKWSRMFHQGKVLQLVKLHQDRVPMVLLLGDVGTGKTRLAETVGDALARRLKAKVHMLKLSTRVRGAGQVGEMSQLITKAFAEAQVRAESHPDEPVLLVIDEADALAESREVQQMHHEDRAGVNTLIQRLDGLQSLGLPIVVIFISNRPDALDPAVRRRSALELLFERPDETVRAEMFRRALPELALSEAQLAELVEATGPDGAGVGFTSSDIMGRLLPAALRAAYPDRPVTPELILAEARRLKPTPPFEGLE